NLGARARRHDQVWTAEPPWRVDVGQLLVEAGRGARLRRRWDCRSLCIDMSEVRGVQSRWVWPLASLERERERHERPRIDDGVRFFGWWHRASGLRRS